MKSEFAASPCLRTPQPLFLGSLLKNWFRFILGVWLLVGAFTVFSSFGQVNGLYSTHVQVNVNAAGLNVPGDAANEPSLCMDPRNPNLIAVGWRQFDDVRSDFRQAGWAYSTNAGLTWTFPGVLEPGTFHSDPVLASDADGTFYYLGVLTNDVYHCDLWRSTNGGASWDFAGLALGGDKAWMTIDRTAGPGRGNLYQAWSPDFNFANDPSQIFSRSSDRGQTWQAAVDIPQRPFWGTLDVGPDGELYVVGWDGNAFWVNRSTNASDPSVSVAFDLTASVDLGGALLYGPAVNPVGLIGQPWIAVDHSSGPNRGNVYVLSSVSGIGNPANVMFTRSTNQGASWSAPRRINDDSLTNNAYHWFGTLSVSPSGRLDACWNDTRNNPANTVSELYFSYSEDGGLTWSPNKAISPPFDHTSGYPTQEKMGDYIGMVSLDGAAMIAYTATFNGEEDIWFGRVELPLKLKLNLSKAGVALSWNTAPGRTYCVEATDHLASPWVTTTNLGCLTGTGGALTLTDPPGSSARFYRVLEQPLP